MSHSVVCVELFVNLVAYVFIFNKRNYKLPTSTPIWNPYGKRNRNYRFLLVFWTGRDVA